MLRSAGVSGSPVTRTKPAYSGAVGANFTIVGLATAAGVAAGLDNAAAGCARVDFTGRVALRPNLRATSTQIVAPTTTSSAPAITGSHFCRFGSANSTDVADVFSLSLGEWVSADCGTRVFTLAMTRSAC